MVNSLPLSIAPAEFTQTQWSVVPRTAVSTPRVPGPSTEELVRRYLIAKRLVVTAGFHAEIAWQHDVDISSVTGRSFLRESAQRPRVGVRDGLVAVGVSSTTTIARADSGRTRARSTTSLGDPVRQVRVVVERASSGM